MDKITFFDDDLEDFEELMELSQEEGCPGAAPAVVLPPIAPSTMEVPVVEIAGVSHEAPPQPSVAKVETATGSKGDPASKGSAASSGPLRFRCRVCGGRHPLRSCAKFMKLPDEKRLREVVKHGYCCRCLALSHRSADCRSKGRCSKCGGDHNILLHSRPTPSQPGKKSVIRPTEPSVPVKKSRPSPSSAPGPSAINQCSKRSLIDVVSLSPSLVVHVQCAMVPIPVRAVLDPCGLQSKICSAFVKNAGLPTSWLDEEQLCRLTVASAYDHTQRLTFTARVCNLEHVFTPPESVPERVKEAYLGLPLADPHFYKKGRVALIIGPDVYADVVTNRAHTTPGMPIAQYTIFGWVLSGVCKA